MRDRTLAFLNRGAGPLLVAVVAALAAVPLGPAIPPLQSAEVTRPPWWNDYHTLVSLSVEKAAQLDELAVMAERGGWSSGWYGAWWLEQAVERRGLYDPLLWVERFRGKGVRNVFYYDVGEFGEFVALAHAGKLVRSAWELRFYGGEPGRLIWFGADAFYRDPPLLELKNYRQFNLQPWTLPDGRPVKSVYELAQRNMAGRIDPWEYQPIEVSPSIAKTLRLEEFLRQGDDPVPADQGASLVRIRSYDHSNPHLDADFRAGVGLMLGQRPAFIHFDNYFDSETLYPMQQAFGPWSLANFRRRLGRLPADVLRRLGVDDAGSFDLAAYIAAKKFPHRGSPAHFRDPRWCDDPLWNFFVVSKWTDSERLFSSLYRLSKTESRAHGSEVVVAGNTIPAFPGGGLITGLIDLVHFEYHVAGQYGPIAVPLGLPPAGRLGGVVRLAASLGTTGYCWPSVYVPRELSGPQHENLHKVLAFDALANRGVLDYHHRYKEGYSPGSDRSAASINRFVGQHASRLGSRRPLADVALVFPGQSMLAGVNVFSMDPEYCLYDYLGWAMALEREHVPWDVVPDEQLADTPLDRFAVVVLPSASCLADRQTDWLLRFATAGGQIVSSGEVGTRYGRQGYCWRRPVEATLANRLIARTGKVASAASAETSPLEPTLGKLHYLDRAAGTQAIGQRIARALAGRSSLLATSAPSTVGHSVFIEGGEDLVVDLVNHDIEAVGDRLAPAPPCELVVRPPKGRRFTGQGLLRSPDFEATDGTGGRPLAVEIRDDGRAAVGLPRFEVYLSLVLPTRPL